MVWSKHQSRSVWLLAKGRLHIVFREVYAVGRPGLTREGWWMACVLACGEGAALSHGSAAALWRICPDRPGPVHVAIPTRAPRRHAGIVAHRRRGVEATTHHGIPVATPTTTLIDLATLLTQDQLEAAINEADKRDLTDPDTLRTSLDVAVSRPGTARLRKALDKQTFTFTDSALERAFLKIVRQSGLPPPRTQASVNGYRVDFYWPELGLVVETDGLRYHRTPGQQAKVRVRDQTHTAAGLIALRFTHAQVRWDTEHVEAILREASAYS